MQCPSWWRLLCIQAAFSSRPRCQRSYAAQDDTRVAPMHVLVVEDDERIRDILTEMLIMRAYSRNASDALSGLAVLRKSDEFDLVMSDFQMPGMTGADLLATMRSTGNSTPLFYSADTSTARRIRRKT